MKIIHQLFVGVAGLALAAVAYGQVATRPARTPSAGELRTSMCDFFDSGGSIYVCRFGKFSLKTEANKEEVVSGVLSVERTLCGTPQKTINVDVVAPVLENKNSFVSAWPPIVLLKDQLLRCRMIPAPASGQQGDIKAGPHVVEVLILKGENDNRIQEFEEICQLHKTSEEKPLDKKVVEGAMSASSAVRRYALEILRHAMQGNDGRQALEALNTGIRGAQSKHPEALADILEALGLFVRSDADQKLRTAASNDLVIVAISDDEAAKNAAMLTIARNIPLSQLTVASVPGDVVIKLTKAAQAASHSPSEEISNSAATVLDWLNKR